MLKMLDIHVVVVDDDVHDINVSVGKYSMHYSVPHAYTWDPFVCGTGVGLVSDRVRIWQSWQSAADGPPTNRKRRSTATAPPQSSIPPYR
jgi:hypothetical protein